MSLVNRRSLVVAAACLILTSGCGAGGGSPRSCGGVQDCGPEGWCVGSTCVDDQAPTAVLSIPEEARALELFELDGSGSSDPDSALDDGIVAYHWTFTSLDQACDPPVVTGTAAQARLRFGCGGAFRAQLVVVDKKGKESAPAAADITVAPYTGSPTIVASADQSKHHSCSGNPLVCTTEGTVPVVSARISDLVQPTGEVFFQWSVIPPNGGPLDEHKRVTFSPSPEVASPSVRIEVDEAAIATLVDDWVLRVRASDDIGILGEAITRISVMNRPPALVDVGSDPQVSHTFSSAAYRASAPTSLWSDPDHDPLSQASGTTGSKACSSVTFGPDGRATVQCVVPFSGEPALGAIARVHEVSVRASDPWTQAEQSWTTRVTVGNRPPTLPSQNPGYVPALDWSVKRECQQMPGTCPRSKDHAPPQSCAAASASFPIEQLADPDGDPIAWQWEANPSAWAGPDGVWAASPFRLSFDFPALQGCDLEWRIWGNVTFTDGQASTRASVHVSFHSRELPVP